jgi:hypothetical protein
MLEAIKMLEFKFGLFPYKFLWRDRVYEVDAVNEVKTITEFDPVYHFWVRSQGQMFHLRYVVNTDLWALRYE